MGLRAKPAGKILLGSFLLLSARIAFAHGVTSLEVQMNEFWSRFGGEYEACVKVYANDILKFLADAPVPADSRATAPIVSALRSSTSKFADLLNTLSETSEFMKNILDGRVSDSRLQIRNLEEQERQTNLTLGNKTAELVTKQQELASAQLNLGSIAQSLESAKQASKTAEEKLDKAQRCIWRSKRSVLRHKRGWNPFKEIVRGVQHIGTQISDEAARAEVRGRAELARTEERVREEAARIEAQARDLVNEACRLWEDIECKRSLVRRTQEELNEQQQRVDSAQQATNAVEAEITSLQTQTAQLEKRRVEFQQQYIALHSQVIRMGEVNRKVNSTLVHVSSLLTSGQTLRAAMSQMIKAEWLIGPLEQILKIYKTVANNEELQSTLSGYMVSIEQSANQLRNKLPLYPQLELTY